MCVCVFERIGEKSGIVERGGFCGVVKKLTL